MATPAPRRSREIITSRANRRPAGFAATLMALAIVFALAWVFFLRSGEAVPAPTIESVRGTYVWQAEAPGASGVPLETGWFGAVAAGDAGGRMTWRNTAPRAGTSGWARSAYDAGGRAETTIESRTTRLGTRTAQTRLVGAWPPVWRVATRSPLDYQGLAAVLRTAVEEGDDSVGIKPLKDGDRAVWRAAMTLDERPIALVVDQATGIVTWYADDRSTFTATVDWASPPPAGETYSVAQPAGAEAKTTVADYSYAASLEEAARAAGYDPLVSGLAPDGFALRAIATTAAAGAPDVWLAAPHSAPVDPWAGRPQVAQLFTRGLSWFEMRQLGPAAAKEGAAYLEEEVESLGRDKLSFQQATLQYGALKGATAFTWYQQSGPALLVSDARRVVFVTGALTRQELISFAEGLKPVTAEPAG